MGIWCEGRAGLRGIPRHRIPEETGERGIVIFDIPCAFKEHDRAWESWIEGEVLGDECER